MKNVNKTDVSVEYAHTYVSGRACIIEEYQYIYHTQIFTSCSYILKKMEGIIHEDLRTSILH